MGIALALIALAGAFVVTGGPAASPVNDTDDAQDEQIVTNVSDSVNASKPVAAALYGSVANDTDGTRVFIDQEGTIIVTFESSAETGERLKEEMRPIAHTYSDIVYNRTNAGGLDVQSNGVSMVVTKDAAIAHANESINDEAFNETLAFTSDEGN